MTTLAIRDFDKELLKLLKVKAAQEGKTLKQIVIELLTESMKRSKE
jgi:plasmid stability protein